jgi:hypothetical protein
MHALFTLIYTVKSKAIPYGSRRLRLRDLKKTGT